LDNAATFDDGTGFVLVAGDSRFDTATITIEFWINVAGSSFGTYALPITRDIHNGQFNGNKPWVVQLNPAADAGSPRTVRWIANGSVGFNADATLPLDSWHHVAITQTGNQAQIYIDSVLAAEGSSPALAEYKEPDVLVGKREDGFFFKGLLDDVALF